MRKFLFRYLPVVLWMSLIFFFSSKTELPVSGTVTEDFLSKKLAHVLEYAILMILMYRAVGEKNSAKAFLFALVFAFSDEIHQLFTPTRTGKLRDVGIDAIGMALSAVAIIKFQLWNTFLFPALPKKLNK
ncbi:MAG: Acetobutylicum phosphotransbutyrylase [Candidatus Collierbacteria bacterium GW2011_GWB1_44_6]|uniref:Acetobutylicum phosphotransbutyrylase n=1 Tax=Candidatus Collierbacteria bacterium GW2011_GWB1_44_6 TaxID=1618384 RepID=A0A0G1MNY2_9BACT|nr:MAG: Acetobutylicum phosphotransbutyrylase [Candidatus Collierbacteria bacterium GW2011_GWB1_44_6]KKT81172.1 MAG: Acetobutylicum phosphotransbutyrylase [Microgenomates group bacterium GW2011_GWC1_44_9]